MATVNEVLALTRSFSREEKLALNHALCEMIKSENRVNLAAAGSKFRIGQVVRFNAKTKGIKHIMIEEFNRARTAVKGYECTPDGKLLSGYRWTVANSLATPV